MKKLCILPCGIIVFILIMLIISPKKDFSENENRTLSKFPEFGIQELIDGDFSKGVSTYIRDHFPMRDHFMGLNTLFARYILGKKEINDVFFASDNYYIEKYKTPENTEKILESFNNLKEKLPDSRVLLCLVPTAVTVYSDKLPGYIPSETSQLDTITKVYKGFEGETVDVTSSLIDNSDKKEYYRLDHHWTTFGAYTAYREIAGKLGFIPLEENYFDIEEVTDDFRGTVFSKLDIPGLSGESIEIYKSNNPLKVYYDDTKEFADSLYNYEYLNKKDKYSMFLDNIHTLIEIDCPEVQSDRELAVIKDSYANCLIPFLTEHYGKIYVFDTRYYKGSVSEFIKEKGISDVLLLYNMNTIDTDLGVGAVY